MDQIYFFIPFLNPLRFFFTFNPAELKARPITIKKRIKNSYLKPNRSLFPTGITGAGVGASALLTFRL